MPRAPFQVLILPFRRTAAGVEFAAMRRADDGSWQGFAGGGEAGETIEAAALRETSEEANLQPPFPLYRLDTTCSVPVYHFAARRRWPESLFVIPEYAFAVDCSSLQVRLSHEHTEIFWGSHEETRDLFLYDSNKTALWELKERIRTNRLGAPTTQQPARRKARQRSPRPLT